MQHPISQFFRRQLGFTLEELICAGLLLALFSGIAVTTYHERRMRSITSRIHSDLRNISMAMEAYRIDRGAYAPADAFGGPIGLGCLSTPVAYLARLPNDPYGHHSYKCLTYGVPTYYSAWVQPALQEVADQVGYCGAPEYMLFSVGPSRMSGFTAAVYDPSNGSLAGIIPLLGP